MCADGLVSHGVVRSPSSLQVFDSAFVPAQCRPLALVNTCAVASPYQQQQQQSSGPVVAYTPAPAADVRYAPSACAENTAYAIGACTDEHIACIQQRWQRQWCPSETVFSPLSSTCLPPSQVPNCVADTTYPQLPSQSQPIVRPACPPTGSTRMALSADVRCTDQYILCVHGVAIDKWCPSGMLFNPATSTCDAAASVCLSSAPPSSDQYAYVPGAGSVGCPSGAAFATAACSEEFVVCSQQGNAEWVRKYCPQGTVFAQSTGTCVPPSMVPGNAFLFSVEFTNILQAVSTLLQ